MRHLIRRQLRRKQSNNLSDISLTPLIDTALTLLIIFMITTPMIQNAVRITLPKGQAKEDGNAQQEYIVYVDSKGTLYFNKEKVADTSTLLKRIDAVVKQHKDRTIFVKADQQVSYGTVIELVDKIKVVSGVKYVALATQKAGQTASTSS